MWLCCSNKLWHVFVTGFWFVFILFSFSWLLYSYHFGIFSETVLLAYPVVCEVNFPPQVAQEQLLELLLCSSKYCRADCNCADKDTKDFRLCDKKTSHSNPVKQSQKTLFYLWPQTQFSHFCHATEHRKEHSVNTFCEILRIIRIYVVLMSSILSAVDW